MKIKNYAEQSLLELAITKAANEEGFSPGAALEAVGARKPSWSPLEVWRTRVKAPSPRTRNEPAQV